MIPTDQEIIELFHEDNRQGLKMAFDKYYTLLCIHAEQITGDLHLAEDVVQSVFIKCWENQSFFTVHSSLRSYLFTAVRNASNKLSVTHLVENIATSAWNPYSGQDARNGIRYRESESQFMYFQDCINRFSSSASAIIQGVKKNENPLMTTMWSMVGFPLSSAVVPVWITPEGTLPSIITAPGKEHAPICDWAMELKNRIIPSMRGSTKYYLDKVQVFNADHTGITQQLIPLNRQIIKRTKNLIQEWTPDGPVQSRVNDHYGWLDRTIEEAYNNLFGIPDNL